MVRREVVFAVPGALDSPTGGYAYDRHVLDGLRARGWGVEVMALSDRFPDPDAATLADSYARLAAVPDDQVLLIDGLALGVLPEIGERLGRVRPVVALVHHPLARETGVASARARTLQASERAALAAARRVVTTSRTTATILADGYGVPRERLVVALPGTQPAPAARGGGGAPVLLSVGSLVPRKGHDVLIEALGGIGDLPWSLVIAGAARDAAEAGRLRRRIATAGLGGRVHLAGAVDAERLSDLYHRADLFVLASRYEGYGMAYAEAIARGLPVVGTTAGAIPEVVPAGAGILVPPDDVAALTRALRELVASPGRRAALARGARLAAAALPRWEATVDRVARAIEAAA